MKTLRKIKTYTIFFLLIAVIGFLAWDGCQSRKGSSDFENQMAEYNVKEQGLKNMEIPAIIATIIKPKLLKFGTTLFIKYIKV